LKGKLTEDQEENLKKAIEDSEKWLKENQNNDKEDYEEELRELEK
jgi:molecular chaperone DnaK (HSP70)